MCLDTPPHYWNPRNGINSATDLVARGPYDRIIARVYPRHEVRQDALPAVDHHAIVLDALQPPPDGVAAVVAGVRAPSEQVRDEAMTQRAGVGEDQTASVLVAARDEQQATERDERVAAPVTPDAARKVWQT